jgi:hypothetical protein
MSFVVTTTRCTGTALVSLPATQHLPAACRYNQ